MINNESVKEAYLTAIVKNKGAMRTYKRVKRRYYWEYKIWDVTLFAMSS